MIFTRPRLRGDRLYFLSEDDLWVASPDGSDPRRLTRGSTRITSFTVSRDGSTIALIAREEGAQDVFTMPAEGGPLTRRSWIGERMSALEFSADDRQIRLAVHRGGPLDKESQLWEVPVDSGIHQHIALGPVSGFAEHGGNRVLCRYATDLSTWKRYRGGRAGRLWVEQGKGWVELPSLGGNLANPFWCGKRIGFVSDHEGHANLYTCAPDGTKVKRLSDHSDFSVRFPSCEGTTIVYSCGGDLWRIKGKGKPKKLVVDTRSQRTRVQPRFPTASRFLGSIALHPSGHSMAVTTRGRPFIGGFWEGPMLQVGERQGVRHTHVNWLDETRLVWVSDASGEPRLEVHDTVTRETRTVEVDLPGTVVALALGTDDRVAVTTHDTHFLIVDLKAESVHHVTRSRYPIRQVAWSADGRWLAWSHPLARTQSAIRLADTHALTDDGFPITEITDGRYPDSHPDFDPLGRYLYFTSNREFSPVPDQNFFNYSFPKGGRPYLVTLSQETPHPFQPQVRSLAKPKPAKPPENITIDLQGISDRVVRFPISEAQYHRVIGLPSGRVLMLRTGGVPQARSWKPGAVTLGRKTLVLWDFVTQDTQVVHTKVGSIGVDRPRKTLVMRTGNKVRVFPADADKGKRAELKKDEPYRATRKSQWVDLNRIRLQVDPHAEWRQMALETWRQMRDHYWEEGMAGVDWEAMRERYLPLIDRASTRSEVSGVLWAMVGEVATSHAYEIGGAYATEVTRRIGRLAGEFSWDGEAWVVDRVHRGDLGDPRRSSPLITPGLGAIEGTRIHAVNGEPVRQDRPLESALIGHSGRLVELEISSGGERRRAWCKPLGSDQGARYRTWVETNRRRIHHETDGRIGYVHVPNMGSDGFSDFHRDYLAESERDGLIVDVRFNGGGHVSQLLLARLIQRRLAYTHARHFGVTPYPSHSVLGPMVALTNENAGSDGDIFSQNWKRLQLGPLIGTRTWGGVVGISPQNKLVDGTVVTQPEYAFWFHGEGWEIEGKGVEPDIEVRHSPDDYLAGRDPQLERGIAEISKLLKKEAPSLPAFEDPPIR